MASGMCDDGAAVAGRLASQKPSYGQPQPAVPTRWSLSVGAAWVGVLRTRPHAPLHTPNPRWLCTPKPIAVRTYQSRHPPSIPALAGSHTQRSPESEVFDAPASVDRTRAVRVISGDVRCRREQLLAATARRHPRCKGTRQGGGACVAAKGLRATVGGTGGCDKHQSPVDVRGDGGWKGLSRRYLLVNLNKMCRPSLYLPTSAHLIG